jgi:hypothetical protein
MSRLVRALVIGAAALLLPAAAYAQATIAGVVKDASGAVLPGVTVEAASAALTEKVRTVTTDAPRHLFSDIHPAGFQRRQA